MSAPRLRFKRVSQGGGGIGGAIPIDSITGTMSNGNTITISGTNLENPQTTGWRSFWTADSDRSGFEGTSPAGDGYGVQWGLGSTEPTYVTNVKLMGSKSLYCSIFNTPATALNCPSQNRVSHVTLEAGQVSGTTTEEIWFRAYGRWNTPNGVWTNYLKWAEIQGTGASNGGVLFQPANGQNQNPPTQWAWTCNAATPNSVSTSTPYGAFELNRWYCVEAHCICSPTIGNQVFEGWIDGVKMHTRNPAEFHESMRFIGLPIGIINGCHVNGGFHCECWTDGVATSTQRIYPASLVELADSSSYSGANKRGQAPVYISDDEVQFTYDDTGLSGVNRYVFVTNNAQERSDAFQVV